MKEEIIELICKNSPFPYARILEFYEEFKSYDLLILAVDSCARLGLSSLYQAPIVRFLASKKPLPASGADGNTPDVVRVFVYNKEIYRIHGGIEQVSVEEEGEL